MVDKILPETCWANLIDQQITVASSCNICITLPNWWCTVKQKPELNCISLPAIYHFLTAHCRRLKTSGMWVAPCFEGKYCLYLRGSISPGFTRLPRMSLHYKCQDVYGNVSYHTIVIIFQQRQTGGVLWSGKLSTDGIGSSPSPVPPPYLLSTPSLSQNQ